MVPNNDHTEPINDNVIVEWPDIELVQPEDVKINLEKNLIEPKASHNFNFEHQNDNEMDILSNNIGPKASDNFHYQDDKILIVSNKIEPRANAIEEIESNLNLQPS
ncbi:unnamed protein product, partial [Rotaria magnacalcarata]